MTEEEGGVPKVRVKRVIVRKLVWGYTFFPVFLSGIDKTPQIFQKSFVLSFHIGIGVWMVGSREGYLGS